MVKKLFDLWLNTMCIVMEILLFPWRVIIKALKSLIIWVYKI